MTANLKSKPSVAAVEGLLVENRELFKELLRESLQEALAAEMTEAIGAEPGERSADRVGYRSGYYSRSLVTRIGKLELRVPRDREGKFSPELFERYQRSEKALVSALAEMYVQGVSTRKVKAITEELCGHAFSASTISQVNKGLDAALERVAPRVLEEPYPYLILDARYEKVRIDGVIRSQAVLIAIGINWDGRRQVLAVELANRESTTSWKDFLRRLKERGLHGVEFVVSGDHDGLKRAVAERLTDAAWQRCYVHFLRNALDHLPRKGADDCLQELRWLHERRDLKEAQPNGQPSGQPHGAPSQSQSQSQSQRKDKPSPTTRPLSAEGFDDFWSAYPKKDAKLTAEKAWAKLNPGVELRGRIAKALAVQKASRRWTKDGGQFIPNAATWLNGKRWEDVLDSVQSDEGWLTPEVRAAIAAAQAKAMQ